MAYTLQDIIASSLNGKIKLITGDSGDLEAGIKLEQWVDRATTQILLSIASMQPENQRYKGQFTTFIDFQNSPLYSSTILTDYVFINSENDLYRLESISAGSVKNWKSLKQDLKDRLDILEAFIDNAADVDSIVNKVSEVLQVFENYPEGVNLLTELNNIKASILLKANSSDVYTKIQIDNFLNQKVDKTTTINSKNLSANITLTKADFSDLNNVDNTSDLNKPISTATQNALNDKVDKIIGKGLSTEDYTTAEKTKLVGIEAQATKNQTDAYLLSRTNHTGTQTASTISDFQAEVSSNTDVVNAKNAQHTHSNKALLDTYDQTNANISDAIVKKHSHANLSILDNTTESFTTALKNTYDAFSSSKKDRLNNGLVRFASSNGLVSNDGKDNDKSTTLQNAHDTINASGVIYLETGTYQNTWNQSPVQTTLLNITKSNITLVCQDFANGSKADIRWRTWTANTILKTGDIVADPDDVNNVDSAIRMNYRSWICNSDRTTGTTWNPTEKAFFTENTTIPLIKFSSTLRGQVKGLTVRGKRAFTIENVPSSGAGVHSFEYCGDLNLYLKTAFYGQLIVDNGNLTLEYDSSLTVGATTTIDLSNLRYVNLIKPKAITSVRSSNFIIADTISTQGSIFDVKNSRYINILAHTNGQILIDSSTELMNIISTANKLNVAGYDYNKIQITNSNFNYINITTGLQSIGLLQKTGDCPHYIRNCIGLDVSQASFLNFALNGDSLVFPRANAINQSTIPYASDDITKGWDLGSTWTLSTGTVYTCYSNAINASVWASSDNILPEVADKATLESTYLIGFGNSTSYAGKYISVVNANGLPITSGTISDGRTANYQIKVGTSGDTSSQLTYKSSISPVQVSGGGVQINDSVVSSTSTYSSQKIESSLNLKESNLNKVSSFSATPNNINYPTEKLIKDSLDLKENTITTLSITKGGTNSSTALTNDKVIISEAGKIIESSTTKTQLSYLDATSSVQTQINAKANDSDVVKLTTNQSISGDKIFNDKVLLPNASLTSDVIEYLVIENNEIKKQTLVISDKYSGNSTDSRTITNSGSLTFTIETGLFFYPLQDVIIYHNNLNHMHGQITSYNSTTGEIIIDITNKTGSGTYSVWKIYYDGATSSNVPLVDNLTTQDANSALTANQGYILNQNKVDKTVIKSTFSATPLDTNLASEKLVKDNLDLIKNTLTYQTNSSTKPSNPNTGDLLIITVDGTSSSGQLEEWKFDGSVWILTGGIPVYNWQLSSSYKANNIVIYDNMQYQANANIPSNTAFVVGTSGQTFKPLGILAEYGSQELTNSVSVPSGSVFTDILSFTLPSAGVWEVTWQANAEGASGTVANIINAFLTDTSNSVISNSSQRISWSSSSSLSCVGTNTTRITTTSSKTFKLRASASYGALFFAGAEFGGDANTNVIWKKIAGFSSITLDIANNAITNAKLAQVATQTIKGRLSSGTGNVEDLTLTQLANAMPSSAIPNWTYAGSLINYWGATTTSPTFANIYRDAYYYRQIGVKNWEIAMGFDKGAGGNNGNGDYLFSLPVGVPDFDTSLTFQWTYTGSIGTSDTIFNRFTVPSSFGNFAHNVVTTTTCQAVIHDARRFRIVMHYPGSAIRAFGSGWYFVDAWFGGTFKMQFQSV